MGEERNPACQGPVSSGRSRRRSKSGRSPHGSTTTSQQLFSSVSRPCSPRASTRRRSREPTSCSRGSDGDSVLLLVFRQHLEQQLSAPVVQLHVAQVVYAEKMDVSATGDGLGQWDVRERERGWLPPGDPRHVGSASRALPRRPRRSWPVWRSRPGSLTDPIRDVACLRIRLTTSSQAGRNDRANTSDNHQSSNM